MLTRRTDSSGVSSNITYFAIAVSCIVWRISGGRVVVLRGGLSLTEGAELQDGCGIARAEGLASKVQKYAIAPVKRSGIAEGPCGQRLSFSSSFDPYL